MRKPCESFLTNDLLAARERHVARGIASAHPIFASRALGAVLVDVDGNEYLDFAAGIGVLAVGHNHRRVIEAVKAQLDLYTHTCFQVAMYEPYVRLAERLNAIVGGEQPKKTALFTTGAEALENAVKIARAFTNRPGVIAFQGAFHGRTLLGMSLTGMSHPYKQNFGPFASEVYHAPYPYEYRGWDSARALQGLQDIFEAQIPPERVAAVVIEPQLGDGGFVPAPTLFMRELRRMTAAHGIVLICDEVQTGFGRTGAMFGFQHAGIEPDVITLAKSLAGGLPLSAVTGRADIMDAPLAGGLGGTYAGNPLACAAAHAVLDILRDERLIERAQEIGELLERGLRTLQERFAPIGDVRGLGAMKAIELVLDRSSKRPHPELSGHIVSLARERGLLLLSCGLQRNVIRLLVPLIATDSQISEALAILEAAFSEACGARTFKKDG